MEKKISSKYILGLINNGYKKVWVNNWVKKFKHGRFHAHLMGDFIYIHYDAFKDWHHKVVYTKRLDKEIHKIKTNCE